jgi:membrane protease YdiL (CAAX protease family)
MNESIEKSPEISPSAAILMFVASFLLSLFLGGAFFVLLGYGPAQVLVELLLAVFPLAYMLSRKVGIKQYVGLEIKPKLIIIGVALGFLLIVLNLIISAVLVSILGESQVAQESNTLIRDTSSSPTGLVLVIIALLMAGICEEFLFRGFLQTAISKQYSPKIAILVSSLAFSIIHFDPQLVYTVFGFAIGLALGYIYYRSHSYVVSAVAHATMNFLVLAFTLLV